MDSLDESVVGNANDSRLNIASSADAEPKHISVISQESDRLSQDTTLMDVIEEDVSDSKKESSTEEDVSWIDCPMANDVLMPMEGYRMWTGNVFFMSLIRKKRSAFLQASTKDQAAILVDLVQAVQQTRRGRFLTAIQKPLTPQHLSQRNFLPAGLERGDLHSVTVWKVMDETDVLIQVAKLLRAKAIAEENGVDKARRKEERKRRRKERRALRKQRALDLASTSILSAHASVPGTEEDQIRKQIPASYMDILQGLYYVPSYYPLGDAQSLRDNHDGELYSSSDTSTSSDDDSDAGLKITKKRRKSAEKLGPDTPKTKSGPNTPKTIVCTENENDQKVDVVTDFSSESVSPALTGTISFHYKPKSMKSHQALIEEAGRFVELPKGVTVRPSGKWQAQTYFAGQSRYIGVYDSSSLAAHAYVVVQDFLRQYRSSCPITKDMPKEAFAAVFATARQIADDAVRQMMQHGDDSIVDASDPSAAENHGSEKKRNANVAVTSSVERDHDTTKPVSEVTAINISYVNSQANGISKTGTGDIELGKGS